MAFRKVTRHASLLVDDALTHVLFPYLISVFKDLKLDYALLMKRCVFEDLALQ